MTRTAQLASGIAFLCLLLPAIACAAPGNTASAAGQATATVLEPGSMQKIDDLRFGQFVQPAASGTLTISPTGVAVPTGGMITSIATPQTGTGRGPALFRLNGGGFRFFHVSLPKQITISNGTSTMTVSNFTTNATATNTYLGATGSFDLYVGGQLQVNALQQGGTYAGTFAITVTYF